MFCDLRDSNTLQEIHGISCRTRKCGQLTGIAAVFLLMACNDPSASTPASSGKCGNNGHFSGQLYGSLEAELQWGPDALQCQGMPRPNNAGARLRFAGSADMEGQPVSIAFILGIPDLQRGQVARELLTNVTVINEGNGRFFATQDIEACWSDIEAQEKTAKESEFQVRGILYCVSPLAELHGNGSLRLSEITFSGLVNWKPPE